MPMKALPMKTNGHADDCMCESCIALMQELHEPKIFGQWHTFRDFVDGMCDFKTPKNAYIYPKFAVLQFEWASDRRVACEYLEEHSSDRYTGVHFEDDDEYWLVLIDVTGEVPEE